MVCNQDTALRLPDSAPAAHLHLVAQVAGRARPRRSWQERVLVQHSSRIRLCKRPCGTITRDLPGRKLPIRQMLGYPPFTSMIRLVIRGPSETITGEFAAVCRAAHRFAAGRETRARVLGPAPAPFARLKGKYRFQIQTQGPDGDKLREAVRHATSDLPTPEERAVDCDVDPLDML